MVKREISKLFRKSSQTFYNSSKLFPLPVRNQISVLYGFVRKCDNFVDAVPQRADDYFDFKNEYLQSRKRGFSEDIIIDAFVKMERKKGFPSRWVLEFLKSMEDDLSKTTYQTLAETEKYIYGSASAVGLLMAKIMDLPEKSYRFAQLLGKSFQFINFIRDIAEDVTLDRNYFPQVEMKNFGLKTLKFEEARKNPDNFKRFVNFQLDRYEKWQKEAEKGFSYIPPEYLIPIKTASDLYKWTGQVIRKDPFVVYRRKIKPSDRLIRTMVLRNKKLVNFLPSV
jgi:phytoene synthase